MTETRQEKIIRLANTMCQNELDTSPSSPEYQVLDKLLTDDELALMCNMKILTPTSASSLARKAGMPVSKARKIMDGMADKAYFMDVEIPKVGVKLYVLAPFAPGLFEFQMTRPGFLEKNPEIGYLFHDHVESYADVMPTMPMGVGVMRVIPVESALPADPKPLPNDRISALLDKTFPQKFCFVPCQCRRVRRIMGEGTGDLEFGMCVYTGVIADSMIRHGRGKEATREEVDAHLKRCEEMGCVHEVTCLQDGKTSAICNCYPTSCMAIGAAAQYNVPNFVRSNYVAEIRKDKCVACGQCVEVCSNQALKLGQKICAKTPIAQKATPLPDDHEWGPEYWNLDYRDTKEDVVPTGTSPCKTACPAHVPVQGYLKLAHDGKYMEALKLIKRENPFPAVCGRICNRRCESECTRGSIDDPVAIDEVKRFIADWEIDKSHRYVPKKHWDLDKKIAIIGSGPASLSCAYYLGVMGYRPTVFEKEMRPGGMLVNGIPNFRLDKNVVNAEIDVLRALGVKFQCGIEVGRDISISQLRHQGYEAFYLGIGLQDGGRLNIPGADAEGVMSGVDFLKQINRGDDSFLHGNVVVIGGGSIGADVARTAIRYGADHVDLYCLESWSEMPMGVEDQNYCQKDGISIHDGWGQTEILTDNGRVRGIRFRKCTAVRNAEGRFAPAFDDSQTDEAQCTAVLYCIGQRPAWGGITDGEPLKLTPRGLVVCDPLTRQTSVPDIFAGGDIYTGQKFAIDAIAAGKEGAISINRYLWKGHSLTIGRDRRNYRALDKDNIDFAGVSYDNIKRQVPGIDQSKVRTHFPEEMTFTEDQVRKETARCLGCGATVVDQNRCLGCGLCTTRCKFEAIHLVKRFDQPVIGIGKKREKYMEEYRAQRIRDIAITKAGAGADTDVKE